MIHLHELLGIKEETFSNYKMHFATGSNDKKEPYNAFLIDDSGNNTNELGDLPINPFDQFFVDTCPTEFELIS